MLACSSGHNKVRALYVFYVCMYACIYVCMRVCVCVCVCVCIIVCVCVCVCVCMYIYVCVCIYKCMCIRIYIYIYIYIFDMLTGCQKPNAKVTRALRYASLQPRWRVLKKKEKNKAHHHASLQPRESVLRVAESHETLSVSFKLIQFSLGLRLIQFSLGFSVAESHEALSVSVKLIQFSLGFRKTCVLPSPMRHKPISIHADEDSGSLAVATLRCSCASWYLSSVFSKKRKY